MRLKPKEIIKKLKLNSGKIRKTARELGISPGTVINWRTRARSIFYGKLQLKVNGLERKSTAPKTRRTNFSASEQVPSHPCGKPRAIAQKKSFMT